jgi:hypothetical protein
MNSIISIIECEAKYSQDSGEGHPQYRSGYLAALRAVSEFLAEQESESAARGPSSQSTDRLLSFPICLAFAALGPGLSCDERGRIQDTRKRARDNPKCRGREGVP